MRREGGIKYILRSEIFPAADALETAVLQAGKNTLSARIVVRTRST